MRQAIPLLVLAVIVPNLLLVVENDSSDRIGASRAVYKRRLPERRGIRRAEQGMDLRDRFEVVGI